MKCKFLAGLLLVPALSYSQADSSKNAIELEGVSVTVNRFEELKREQPIQLQRISARTIEFQNAPNTADMLINSGNVFVQKSQAGGGSPVLRGFEANRILLVIDGIRMNNAIFRGGHLQNILRVDQAILENAEVIFGPSSLIYGSDALGGVISFKTKDPKYDQTFANAYVRYGSATQEQSIHGDFNFGGKKWASFSSLTVSKFGDVIQGKNRRPAYPDFGKRLFYQSGGAGGDVMQTNPNPNIQVGSGYEQVDFLQKISFRPKPTQEHIVNVQASLTGDVPRYDRLSEIRGDVFRSAEWYYGPEQRLLTAYELRLKGRRLFDNSSIKLAYQDIQESRNNRRWNAVDLFTQQERVKIGSLTADFVKYAGPNTYQYGLEFVHNDVNSVAYSIDLTENSSIQRRRPAATRYPDGGSQLQTASVYLTTKNEFVDERLFINYGVRYSFTKLDSKFNDKTFFPFDFDTFTQQNGALVGNAGITFTPSVSNKFSVLFSNGFRVPNVDDLAKVFDSVPGQVIVPNANVKPETTYSFEVGAEQQIGGNLQINVSAYYTVFDNVLVIRPFSIDGKRTIRYQGVESEIVANQNADVAKILGGNINASYRLSANCRLTSTYNIIKGNLANADKTPLDHIPPSHGKTSFSYDKNKFRSEVFGLYNGWKRLAAYSPSGEDNQQYATPDGTPSWWTLNLRTSYQFCKYLTAQVAVENILDKNYRYFASGISAPGRNFIVTVRGSI